jgi:[ribosomal protein S18]-alanine N-acetyltransferase
VPYTIRDFQAADFEILWSIDQQCFDPEISYSRAELHFYIQRPSAFTLVAVANVASSLRELDSKRASSDTGPAINSSIAGFIVAESHRNSGHIITIDVVASARRSGVGSLLLSAAEDRLRTGQCRSVELETAVDNISALSFYKRHGYTIVRTFPRYYSNGLDALVLEKNL